LKDRRIDLLAPLADCCEKGKKLAALFVFLLYLFHSEPPGFYDDFQPILGFTGFTLTNLDPAFEIGPASGPVRLAVIRPYGGTGLG
jgi:hypothetical protein